jgi:cytochrome c nitrite reductase small subunit
MQFKWPRRPITITLALALMTGAVTIFLALGPPRLLARSEAPEFCARCHVMEEQYTAWSHAGAHRRLKCVDCHLPNGNPLEHYVWKGIDGMKDVVSFNTGLIPERIELSDHGKSVLQANCIRCHAAAVSQMDTSRQCWGCHRQLRHRLTGTVATKQ